MSLPSGYTQYEYLQSSGTQYIDTGFCFSSTPTRVVIDFQFLTETNNRWIFGDYGKGGVEAGIYSNRLYTGYFTYTNTSATSRGIGTSEWHTSTTMTESEFLFARNIANESDRGYATARVYSLRIETETDVLMNLVPAKRDADGVLGMYDTVNDIFLTNQGTGAFFGATSDGIFPINQQRSGFFLVADVGGTPNTTSTDSTSYMAFIPLVCGLEYTIKVETPDIRLRAGTFANEPTTSGINGIRTVCTPQVNPSSGFSFSFTAESGENVLVLYGGVVSDGASGLGTVKLETVVFTHNYISVEDIISAGTSHMVTRVNTPNDDGSIEITAPPSWLKFNGIMPTTMYTSGNTWIGVGSANEHIKFNRRDTKIYYFYTEEGTLYNYYRFYKMRWRGYSVYNQTGSSYLQEWEVIFFDTGDLMIHAVQIPTSSYNGSFNIVASQTYSYNAPTTASPYVSFYTQDADNRTFSIAYEIIDIPMPYDRRWLIKDGDVFYNITDGVLTALEITELTAENLLEYGNEEPPDGSLLLELNSPIIYHWNNSTDEGFIPTQPSIRTTLTATPFTQNMDVLVDMSHETITGIVSVTAQYSGNLKVKYSLDDGATYTDEYSVTDFLNLDFTEIYEQLPVDKVLYLRFVIYAESSLTSLQFTFNNT